MERSAILAISIWFAVISSLTMVSLTSYAYYSNNDNYIGIVEDPGWLEGLPSDLSMEVSKAIADILSLDEGATERVYEAILDSTDEAWAKEEGIEVINDILEYITGGDDEIESSISIDEYKSPVIQAVITFIPSFLADTISELLPDSIPLSALINMEDLDNTRQIFSIMENIRYIFLAILLISIPFIIVFHPNANEYLEIAYNSTLFALALGLISLLLMTLRIEMSFNNLKLSFVKSFGNNLDKGYLKSSIPFLIIPLALFLIVLFIGKKRNL